MAIRVWYTILNANGNMRRRDRGRGAGSLFDKKGTAVNHANIDGDSVVEVVLDLDREPIFIRRKKLKPEE